MPDTIVIRPHQTSDWPALEQIFLDARLAAFHWHSPAQLQAQRLQPQCAGERLWVAEQDGRPLGFLSLWAPEHFIHHLYVDPQRQGTGLGRRLLLALPGWSTQRYSLKCLQQNLPALAFYRRHGFACRAAGTGPDGPYWRMESAPERATDTPDGHR